jgi:hypothetical protein
LKRNCHDFQKTVVDTNGLKTIHPFGPSVVQNHLSEIKIRPTKIVFTGKNRELLAGNAI